MRTYTFNHSNILRNFAFITLFCFSSVTVFAVIVEGKEEDSKTPSIQPRSVFSPEHEESEAKDLNILFPSNLPQEPQEADSSVSSSNVISSVQSEDPEIQSLRVRLEYIQLPNRNFTQLNELNESPFYYILNHRPSRESTQARIYKPEDKVLDTLPTS